MPTLAGLVLLAGPTVLSFFTGGYFDQPRLWAALAAWLLVALALVTKRDPLPSTRAAWLAVAGLAAYTAVTFASISWAPVAGSALVAAERDLLYLGALLAAMAWLREPGVRRALEPAVAGGALIVVGYGLSERLLPGLLHFARSVTAEHRLEQPLTYWNAMGELAALGIVLSVRLAADRSRPTWMHRVAAAATVPLALGLYLSFSRGALFACAAGLLTLLVAVRSRTQLAVLGACAAPAVACIVVAGPQAGFTSLAGSLSSRELQGAIVFLALVLCAGAAALLQRRAIAVEERPLPLPQRPILLATLVVALGLGVVIVVGARERTSEQLGGGAARLVHVESDRYAYWGVALREFVRQPLRGVGAGGWAVDWLRERKAAGTAVDAHSLPLQTAAELGLLGVAALVLLIAGSAAQTRRAYLAAPTAAAGPLAALVAYAAHAPLDWDWEMPALTLFGILVLAALLIATGEASPATVTP